MVGKNNSYERFKVSDKFKQNQKDFNKQTNLPQRERFINKNKISFSERFINENKIRFSERFI